MIRSRKRATVPLQVSAGSGGIESKYDQIAETDLRAAEVSSGTEGIKRPDEQILETNGAVQVSSGTQGIESLDDQISED